jgi:hypothetical protein
MKKRVRLYKAQEGMQVQDPQQLQQMLVAQVQSDKSQGIPLEETVYNIYNSFKEMFNNPQEVQEFVASVYESIDAQEQQVNQQMQQQPENSDMVDMQDQMAAQAEAGMQMAQMGAQVGNPSYFTGIDAYVPPNYMDMISNPAFAFGGQKSKYVKQQLALAKKQMGGQEEAETSGPDEIGQNERNQRLKAFVSGLKEKSTMANVKKQAEQQYDQMMMMPQAGMMTAQDGGQQDFTHYTHGDADVFHDQMNYLVEAQYGGMTSKQQRQLQRSMSRIPFGAVPTTPIERIDVRKSGIFGRPKEYSIDFASPLQAIGAPGGASAYGYGVTQSTQRKTEGKKGTVTIPGTPAENKKEVVKAEETTGNTTTGGTDGTSTDNTNTNTNTDTNTIEDNTIVETPKPAKGSNYQYIPGKPFVYTKSADEKSWLYQKENDSKWSTVTNQDSLALLNTGQSKSGQLVTLTDKPGYYYRRRNDGSYVKFKGDPANHYEGKAPIKSGDKPMIIKPGDKNYDYLDKNSTWNLKPYIPKVAGNQSDLGKYGQDLVNSMYPNTPVPKLTQEDRNKLALEEVFGYTSEEYKDYENLPWYEKMFTEDPRSQSEKYTPGYVDAAEDYGLMPTHFITTLPGTAMNLIEGTGANPNLLNAGQKMLNAGQGMLGTGAQRAALNPGAQRLMLNPGTEQYLLKAGQKMLNPPPGFQYRMPFAAGGNVMNPGMDMYGNLQRFVYGGGDDPSIPFISQADMNYTNSKDTSDAYFQDGGEENSGYVVDPAGFSKAVNQVNPLYQSDARFQNLFPDYQVNPATKQQGQTQQPLTGFGLNMAYPGMFNSGAMMPWYAGSWNKVTKGPYGASGQSFNMPIVPGGNISKIDVTKSGLRGQPKKYSITYNNPNQLAPRTTTPGTTTPAAKPADSKFSNTEGLGFGPASAIRRGERQTARQLARGEKEFGTAEQQAQQYNKSNPMQPMATLPQMKRVLPAAEQFEAMPTNKMPTSVNPYQRSFVNSAPFNQSSYIQKEYGDIIPEIKDYYDVNAVDATPEAASERVEAAMDARNAALQRQNYGTSRTQILDDYQPIPYTDSELKPINEASMKRNPMMLAYGGNIQYQTGNQVVTPIDQDERLEPLPVKTLEDLKPLGQQMMMDSRQKIADEANFAPEEYTVDYKVKNAFNVNKPMAIGAANAFGNKLASFIGGRQEEDFRPLTQEELVGTTARRQEGLYSEYGDFKPDKQANLRSGLFSKYGGSTVGDELDMTEEEIEEFLANGGELEFI